MSASDKKVEALEAQVGVLVMRVGELEAQVGELELAGLTAVVARSQWPVEVVHRCGHRETHPFKVSPDSVLGKKYQESECGKDCNKCEQTLRQKATIKAAQAVADGIVVDESAMTSRG